jgi:hypothetical protein
MTKIFISDESRIHHHHACKSNDFGDCYDRAAHSIGAVLLQNFGVPQLAINVLLATMKTMRFFLHTGFGESATLNILLGMDKAMQLQALVVQL